MVSLLLSDYFSEGNKSATEIFLMIVWDSSLEQCVGVCFPFSLFFQSFVRGKAFKKYKQSELLVFLLLHKCIHTLEMGILVEVDLHLL